MSKQTIITMMLALVAVAGLAQTKKTAIVKGYSPALEDSTVVNIYIDNMSVASDTVFGGRFTLSVPVEKLSKSSLFLWGKGCPNYLSTLFLSPGVTTSPLSSSSSRCPFRSPPSPTSSPRANRSRPISPTGAVKSAPTSTSRNCATTRSCSTTSPARSWNNITILRKNKIVIARFPLVLSYNK